MSNIIPTPPQAQLVEGMPVIDGQATSSVKTAVTTPEGLYAANLKPLLDHYYNALHMQILHSLANPFEAFNAGYVLLNGTQLPKANFPRWQKLVDYNLAIEINDETIELLDLTTLYTRPSLADVGSMQEESLPNITGTIGWVHGGDNGQQALGAFFDNRSLPSRPSAHGSFVTHTPTGFDASLSSPTYGRRDEVAPTSILTYAYAFIGEYRGTTPEPTLYYLIDSDGTYLGKTLTLANNYGYNPIYMTADAPPITQEPAGSRRSVDTGLAYRYVDGYWRRVDR